MRRCDVEWTRDPYAQNTYRFMYPKIICLGIKEPF